MTEWPGHVSLTGLAPDDEYVEGLEDKVARALALHYRVSDTCAHCQFTWPCPTFATLGGEGDG